MSIQQTAAPSGGLHKTSMTGSQVQTERTTRKRCQSAVRTCDLCKSACPVPVLMVTCGHCFCLHCLENFWQHLPNCERPCPTCMCPEFLHPEEPQPVACDVCPAHAPCAACWSCLTCRESFCPEHFQPHMIPEGEGDGGLAGHHVCEAMGEEAQRMRAMMGGSRCCPEHKERVVELFCNMCKMCICTICPLLGTHQGHTVRLIEEAAQNMKNLTSRCLKQLDQKKNHILGNIQHIELAAADLKAHTLASTESLTVKFAELRLLLDEEEKLSKKFMEDKTKLALWAYDSHIESCREHISNIDNFSSRTRCIEHQTDAITLIKEYVFAEEEMLRHMSPADQIHPVPVTFGHIENYFNSFTEAIKISVKEPLGKRLKNSIFSSPSVASHLKPGSLVEIKSYADRSLFLKDGRCPTLNPDTMHSRLRLSDDLLTVYCAWFGRFNSGEPQRFDKLLQVMSRDCFYSGSHYWEVDLSQAGQGWWIGITYPSIKRKGDSEYSRLGWNIGSWCIKRYEHEHWAFHKGERTPLHLDITPERVGVFLDYESGVLSFYDVTSGMKMLHTFRCKFTESVYPALRLWGGSITMHRLN